MVRRSPQASRRLPKLWSPVAQPPSFGPLSIRIASALVLAPPALGAVYLGGPYAEALVLLVAAVLAWEWARLCGEGRLERSGWIVIAASILAVLLAAFGLYAMAGWLLLAGALVAGLSAFHSAHERAAAPWYAFGVVYVALPTIAFLWLRRDPSDGLGLVIWILAVVWATDIMAFFCGRAIGGAKLAPSWSPKKTWAGLIGGAVAAFIAGFGVALYNEWQNPGLIAGLSVLLALVEQSGDLLESRVKRRFGAKDSSNLIPGHGGLLDRVDGLLAASLAVAAVVWVRGATL